MNRDRVRAKAHNMAATVTLVPLTGAEHAAALQAVYESIPHYWQLYGLPGAPAGEAARDLEAAAATPGRTLMGMARLGEAGPEWIGMADFRLGWPEPELVYLGRVMVVEPLQRQGYGTAAWALLGPWLAQAAGMGRARTGVEQFNPGALKFLQSLGFALTGASDRVHVGSKWVRVLYLGVALGNAPTPR